MRRTLTAGLISGALSVLVSGCGPVEANRDDEPDARIGDPQDASPGWPDGDLTPGDAGVCEDVVVDSYCNPPVL